MTIFYVTGPGTDSSEQGRSAWSSCLTAAVFCTPSAMLAELEASWTEPEYMPAHWMGSRQSASCLIFPMQSTLGEVVLRSFGEMILRWQHPSTPTASDCTTRRVP